MIFLRTIRCLSSDLHHRRGDYFFQRKTTQRSPPIDVSGADRQELRPLRPAQAFWDSVKGPMAVFLGVSFLVTLWFSGDEGLVGFMQMLEAHENAGKKKKS